MARVGGRGDFILYCLTMASWVTSSSEPASQTQSTDNTFPFYTVSSGLQERGTYHRSQAAKMRAMDAFLPVRLREGSRERSQGLNEDGPGATSTALPVGRKAGQSFILLNLSPTGAPESALGVGWTGGRECNEPLQKREEVREAEKKSGLPGWTREETKPVPAKA